MKHIHIVGCPRSGTTLMMELMSACFQHDQSCDHEISIFEPSPDNIDLYISKKPTDILHIKHIFERDPNLFVIYLVRDPRAVFTSKHHSNRDIYFCNYKIWKKCDLAAESFEGHPRFLTIRYEDLVEKPDACQKAIATQFEFLQEQHQFSEYHKFAKPPEDALKAMEGLRPVNSASLDKWKQHLPRVKEQLQRNPTLTSDLIRRGYEPSKNWEQILKNTDATVFPCRYPEKDNPLKEGEKALRMWWRSKRYLRQHKL
ncbi:sulfotransferase [Aestuariicella hydrocarbonica]|uniref:Sulfotransferase n=1 Tax=Pseudomaricurvus hydrocarbonicus TaxID=1470433 RepID=A0A9E5JWG4_9GAMM|nr:sulfotransferase [Aestuariicella hydrocarbonica]NHO66544.1 sulfotransferase [Aestuariicella hydrocarbonica]